jgi:hypothetical protein
MSITMDIDTIELENKMLRERNDHLQVEILHLQEDLKAAIKAYRELLINQDKHDSTR